MTNKEKQALIEYCEREIEKFKLCIAEYPDAAVLRSDLKLHEIALTALAAQPVKCPSFNDYKPHVAEELRAAFIAAIRAAGYEVAD